MIPQIFLNFSKRYCFLKLFQAIFQDMKHRMIREIIQDAGGAAAAAKEIDVHPTTICKWFHNGIPYRYWPTIIKLAQSSADELLAANEQARHRGDAA